MPVQIEISENDLPVLVEFYGSKLKSVDSQIEKLSQERASLQSTLDKLLGKDKKQPTRPVLDIFKQDLSKLGFDPNWTILSKVTYILSLSGKPMSSREVTDRLFDFQPELKAEYDKTSKNVSTILSINNGPDKKFLKATDGGVNYFFINKKSVESA